MYLRQYTHSLEISKARGKVKLKKKAVYTMDIIYSDLEFLVIN